MARDTGKWVARAGATGGSRIYRGQKPVNWYAALLLIAVVGLASVVYSRYQYQNPTAAASSSTAPTTADTWQFGLQTYICGANQTLPAQSKLAASISEYTTGQSIVTIHPTDKSQTGKKATLGLFIKDDPGLTLTPTTLGVPGGKTYANGDKCAKGTPDAGKAGKVVLEYYADASSEIVQSVSDPTTLKPADYSMVVAGFVPAGTKVPKDTAIADALVADKLTTTTTAPAVTTTTLGITATSTPGATTAPPTAAPTTTPTTAASATSSTVAPTSTTTSKAP